MMPAPHPLEAADVRIVRGMAKGPSPHGEEGVSMPGSAERQDFYFEVPDVARFRITGKSLIVVEAAPGADDAAIRLFLLGSALGALLMQRDLLVLHGNAIAVGERCLVCVGPSGVGKSTLTGRFIQRGYRVLADDVVPIDRARRAIPGLPRIKLWKDVADKLNIETEGLSRIRPTIDKFNLALHPGSFCAVPVAVDAIYALSQGHSDEIEMTPVTGMEKFVLIQQNTYRPHFITGMSLQLEHLRQCGDLARSVRTARVSRPTKRYCVDELVERLLADFAGITAD